MFGPSNWAIIGIQPASHTAFLENFNKQATLLNISQLTASAITRGTKIPTFGINPFESPRLDENVPMTVELMGALLKGNQNNFASEEDFTLVYRQSDEVHAGFANRAIAYRIDPDLPIYGLWFIANSWKDNADAASLKEGKAYEKSERPYKFLTSEEKKQLDLEVKDYEAPARKQYPVILDFQAGRLYAEVTSDVILFQIDTFLTSLGAQLIPLAWDFASPNWVSEFLTRTHQNTHFTTEFRAAAAERQQFQAEESEDVVEDPEIRKLVRKHFAMTELETEQWIGLSAPAAIQMYHGADAVGAASQTSATQLLQIGGEGRVRSAAVSLEEQHTFTTKEGVERVYMAAEYEFDLNEMIHSNKYYHAALLKGFDLPDFTHRIKKEIRQSKQVPEIRSFWLRWLQGMDAGTRYFAAAVKEVLGLEGNYGLVTLAKQEDGEPTTDTAKAIVQEFREQLKANGASMSVSLNGGAYTMGIDFSSSPSYGVVRTSDGDTHYTPDDGGPMEARLRQAEADIRADQAKQQQEFNPDSE
jgi:hypothetical protein